MQKSTRRCSLCDLEMRKLCMLLFINNYRIQGHFFEVCYLSRLVSSPVALSVYRTSKVYNVVARRLVGLPVALSVYRTSKVYYLVAWRLVGSPVALSVYRTSKVYYLVAWRFVGSPVALSVYKTSKVYNVVARGWSVRQSR